MSSVGALSVPKGRLLIRLASSVRPTATQRTLSVCEATVCLTRRIFAPRSARLLWQRLPPQSSLSRSPSFCEFAAPLSTQLYLVVRRDFEDYWRTPSYLYSKILLCTESVSSHRDGSQFKLADIPNRLSLTAFHFGSHRTVSKEFRINSSRSFYC